MEKQPIKRNINLQPISREHHSTLLFSWKLKKGISKEVATDRIVNYIHWYAAEHLYSHFDTEERLLVIDKEEEMIKRMLEEHQQMKNLINGLEESEDLHQDIVEIADLVNAHTRFEERELFPFLEEKFSEEQLTHIGKQLNAEIHDATENYKDEFWK